MSHRRVLLPVAVGLALLLGLSIPGLGGPARAAAYQAKSSPPPIAVGVNIADAPDQASVLQGYDQLVGHAPALVMWYQEWSEPLYYQIQATNMLSTGAAPVITWDPSLNGVGIPLSQIVAGRYDAYIESSAQAAKSYGHLMFIRFGHEMNLAGSPFGSGHVGDTPQTFVAAWRHVVDIFRRAGVTNVEWVWSPNEDCDGKCPFGAYYPGDAYVDWVALDGYNYSSVDHMPWETFDQIFRRSYAEMTALTSKPMMIAETASTELGGSKARWITQSFADLAANYPQIHAVIWFDRDKETNWMVDSSSSSLTAWKQVVASPRFAGTPSTLAAISPTSADVDSGQQATNQAVSSAATEVASPTRTPSGHSTRDAGRKVKTRSHRRHRAAVRQHGRHHRRAHHRRGHRRKGDRRTRVHRSQATSG